MKNEEFLLTLLLLILLVPFQLLNIIQYTETEIDVSQLAHHPSRSISSIAKPMTYITHDPIEIDGNIDFISQATTEGWDISGTRDGTQEKPYLINGLIIQEFPDNLINIRNVDLHFQITNCYLTGGAINGIEFKSVENGQIINNTLSNNTENGIMLESSPINIISNNTIRNNNVDGIRLCYSTNNIIDNNTVNNNVESGIILFSSIDNIVNNNSLHNNSYSGIDLFSSAKNNIISNNTTNNNGYGVAIGYSSNNTISNNKMSKDGLCIYGSDIEDYLQRQVVDNLVNGKPLIYWQNTVGGVVPYDAGQVILINTSTITIRDQNLSDTSIGLFAAFCRQLNIFNNTISNNREWGIMLYSSTNTSTRNNTINNNRYTGIWLFSSTNNTIENNSIYNNTEKGVHLDFSADNIISNNTISNNNDGILLEYSVNNTMKNNNFSDGGINIAVYSGEDIEYLIQKEVVDNLVNGKPLIYWQNTVGGVVPYDAGQVILVNTSSITIKDQILTTTSVGLLAAFSHQLNISFNTINNNTRSGIALWKSDTNIIYNNTVRNNSCGMQLEYSANNTISGNSISNNKEEGIYEYASNNNTIYNDTINNNGLGISLYHSDNTCIGDSTINNNRDFGIRVSGSASNTIGNNTIKNNTNHGIHLGNSANIVVSRNNFIKNNLGGNSQANDSHYEGSNNTFQYNYWDDWTSPDKNENGIVDIPYTIDGNNKNLDPYPITIPYKTGGHFLSKPILISPIGGETLQGTVTIQWTASADSLGHTIVYDIELSTDGGTSWTSLITGLTTPHYVWDSTTIADGNNYLVKINASCVEGLWQVDISDSTFSIINTVTTGTPTKTTTTSTPTTIVTTNPPTLPVPSSGFSLLSVFVIIAVSLIIKKKDKR